MLLFTNLPFTSLVTSTPTTEQNATAKLIPCIILGVFTLLIYFALMIGYMGPVGVEVQSPQNEAPVDKWLALKAALIVFSVPFLFSLVTSLFGSGIFGSTKFYETMRFPHNLLYGPVFGFLLAFYPKSWLTPLFPAPITVVLIQVSYWIIIKGFKLPRIFYRQK